jgi:hypothetical protein
MKNPRFFLRLSLLTVILASCSPGAVTGTPGQSVSSVQQIEPSVTPFAPASSPQEAVAAPTEAALPTPFPIATSRGPDLHATDPTTVSLVSGQLQFVEFFRFT